ncbi:uncharacterized protein E0L32_002716 [Thyridium curvatum]|uniref:Uncharacterized protein n=1 Tax=Thyridium curvatum TaxID=1093900 RepID=A0A507BE29_9PEZI|nr:uncharacterized protein E0L32_002716 [Thyridium curvatum]TPX18207.1 hypothetical protein E0L32_002716 [Thyridium curvatum]
MSSNLSRGALRPLAFRLAARHSVLPMHPRWVRHINVPPRTPKKPAGSNRRLVMFFFAALFSAGAVVAYPIVFQKQEPAKPIQAELEFEKKRKRPKSKEDNRDLISSQHLQVKDSWEHPGVYAWGANSGKVAAPGLADTVVKLPRRIPYFDGKLLRDLKLDRDFGAAILENGDLVQWGNAFSTEASEPIPTLKGKDLVKISLSRDRILALSSGGNVYSIPASQNDQTQGEKGEQSSSGSLWSNASPVSYRTLLPANLGWREKVVDISSGLEHCLLLTSSGRVFSAASSSEAFPDKGQMGVPGLTWNTRPKGPFDQPHEIAALRGFKITKVAAGDYHSLVLDNQGRVFSFGDNSVGQLGFPVQPETPLTDVPSMLPFTKLYSGTNLLPQVTSIAAGGANSFFTVDATRVAAQGSDDTVSRSNLGKVVADTWACGEGIHGGLGTGKWTHISGGPTKIKALSNLFEYDEKKQSVVPIRLSDISVGSTHAAAVMDNVTNLAAAQQKSENDTNWGADIVWWGGNEFYQLGSGKRNNVNEPMYIGPLDGGRGDAAKGRKGEAHRFQITPRTTVRLGEGGKGRKVQMEQRVECGRYVTAVYSSV